MGTITTETKADRSRRYRAEVRRCGERFTKRFRSKKDAQKFIAEVEDEIIEENETKKRAVRKYVHRKYPKRQFYKKNYKPTKTEVAVISTLIMDIFKQR